VNDFEDLLGLLDQHPEWQAELRRRLLSDDLLELPSLVRQLAEAQVRTEQRLETLTARVETLTERMGALTARMDALTARIDSLVEAQTKTQYAVTALEQTRAQLVAKVSDLTDTVGGHSGDLLELRYSRRAGAYFYGIARRLRHVDHTVLADRLDEGGLTEAERREVLRADIGLEGRSRDDGSEVYLVIEVSRGIGRDDVERAAARSATLAKLGKPALPVVAGEWISTEVERMADSFGVWRVLDGREAPPVVRG
jgi:hypothetical protein